MKILMVCMGNICRSPMAEGIARHLIRKNNIADTEVDSAGTFGYHIGARPDTRARAVMKAHGIPIDDLRARLFCDEDFARFDVILVADRFNYEKICTRAGSDEQRRKVALMLETLPENPDADLPDPYYGTKQDFEHTYQLLYRALLARLCAENIR